MVGLAVASSLLIAPRFSSAVDRPARKTAKPASPIQHIVVIFQENVSFDHYFGTYPHAANPPGEPPFTALPNTPQVDGLTPALLHDNPNAHNPANGAGAVNPFRLDRSRAATADQGHAYTPEQMAYHNGKLDLFPKSVGARRHRPDEKGIPATTGETMGYFDGNTVTALWNYAQHFAMSDRSFDTTYGPSTPGAINLISGQTNGVIHLVNGRSNVTDGGGGTLTMIGDNDPYGDVCTPSTHAQFAMAGPNIGNLLNEAGVTWGWFEGGFDLTVKNPNGTTGCERSTTSKITGVTSHDYVPHHEPFQYYASTANPTHARPASVMMIGKSGDKANHQYDLHDFYDAIKAGNFPAVSFLKAPAYQDGHAGNSDPIDEQHFIVHVLNFLQQQKAWRNTAVIIAYDDSDGWYDHVMPPLVNPSSGSADALTGPGHCGDGSKALPGMDAAKTPHAQGRCGYGPRLPLLVISPWAKQNFVDSTVTDQTSIARLIEDTFLHGRRIGQGSMDVRAGSLSNMFDFRHSHPAPYLLDEETGEPLQPKSAK